MNLNASAAEQARPGALVGRGRSMVIVVKGVSGSGKSSCGQALATAPGRDFFKGDDMHPPLNVEEMRAGIALNDSDRRLNRRQPDHAGRALQHVKAQMRFGLPDLMADRGRCDRQLSGCGLETGSARNPAVRSGRYPSTLPLSRVGWRMTSISHGFPDAPIPTLQHGTATSPARS